jgi:ABC-type phosphate transport system substrate-binding protein
MRPDSRYLDSSKVGENNMDMSLHRRFGSGTRALLVGLGVLGCCLLISLMSADASLAAAPEKGVACNATEGKINGRGSTYQTVLLGFYAELYEIDVCGATPKEPADVAGSEMLTYNYAAAESAGATGSGAGIKAASCRSDAFSGSDTPYTEANYKELNGAPGTTGGCKLAFEPPFGPHAPSNEYPNSTDVTAPVMSFPVGGSSVTVPVNLAPSETKEKVKTTACLKGTPTALEFSAKEVSRLLGGDVATWADTELVANNPILTTDECTGAVTRVVRFDSSGTTNIFKSYLIRAENERTGQKCAEGKKWEAYLTTNTEWPGKQKPGEEGTCSTITTGGKSGNPALLERLKETSGAVGYVDLPQEAVATGIITPTVQNATTKAPQAPNSGKAANCNYAVATLPGASASDAVGLNSEDNWANNNKEVNGLPNHGNVTDEGSKYPICGLTWDFVYTGLNNNKNENNAITPLTADQRRTLYGFFIFVLSSTAQEKLSTIDYGALPSSWLEKLQEGFRANF